MTASVCRPKGRGRLAPPPPPLNPPLADAAEGARDVISPYVTKQLTATHSTCGLHDACLTLSWSFAYAFCLACHRHTVRQYVQQA